MYEAGYPRVTHPSAALFRTRSLDLHVLGTPPAFILSQDQTLFQWYQIFPSRKSFNLVCLAHFTLLALCDLFRNLFVFFFGISGNVQVVFFLSVFLPSPGSLSTPVRWISMLWNFHGSCPFRAPSAFSANICYFTIFWAVCQPLFLFFPSFFLALRGRSHLTACLYYQIIPSLSTPFSKLFYLFFSPPVFAYRPASFL